jgi:hypothetical protein
LARDRYRGTLFIFGLVVVLAAGSVSMDIPQRRNADIRSRWNSTSLHNPFFRIEISTGQGGTQSASFAREEKSTYGENDQF